MEYDPCIDQTILSLSYVRDQVLSTDSITAKADSKRQYRQYTGGSGPSSSAVAHVPSSHDPRETLSRPDLDMNNVMFPSQDFSAFMTPPMNMNYEDEFYDMNVECSAVSKGGGGSRGTKRARRGGMSFQERIDIFETAITSAVDVMRNSFRNTLRAQMKTMSDDECMRAALRFKYGNE